MITPTEKELIIAYFQGGNARENSSASLLKEMLEAIKESAKDSKAMPGN